MYMYICIYINICIYILHILYIYYMYICSMVPINIFSETTQFTLHIQ